MPVILVVYDAAANRAYWADLQRLLVGNHAMERGTITVRIPASQVLDSIAVRRVGEMKTKRLREWRNRIGHG